MMRRKDLIEDRYQLRSSALNGLKFHVEFAACADVIELPNRVVRKLDGGGCVFTHFKPIQAYFPASFFPRRVLLSPCHSCACLVTPIFYEIVFYPAHCVRIIFYL